MIRTQYLCYHVTKYMDMVGNNKRYEFVSSCVKFRYRDRKFRITLGINFFVEIGLSRVTHIL